MERRKDRFKVGDWLSFRGRREVAAPGQDDHDKPCRVTVLTLEDEEEGTALFTARVSGVISLADSYLMEFHDGEPAHSGPVGDELLRPATDDEIEAAVRQDVRDYQLCRTCGFDHRYEPAQSAQGHGVGCESRLPPPTPRPSPP